jgi:hypothetical protein
VVEVDCEREQRTVVSRRSATRWLRRQPAHSAAAKMKKAIEESMRGLVIGGELESYHVFPNGS